MFVGYATECGPDVFRMYDPEANAIRHARDVRWLGEMYYQRARRDINDDSTIAFHLPEQTQPRIQPAQQPEEVTIATAQPQVVQLTDNGNDEQDEEFGLDANGGNDKGKKISKEKKPKAQEQDKIGAIVIPRVDPGEDSSRAQQHWSHCRSKSRGKRYERR